MIVELIDDFLADYPATPGGSDTVDTDEGDEVIVAIAKTFAELTSRQDGVIRQQLVEQLMREIMNYDAEFRRDDATGESGQMPIAKGDHYRSAVRCQTCEKKNEKAQQLVRNA